MHILAELSPLDTVGGSRVTLRAASAQDRRITSLNGVRWWPAITELPSLGIRLFDGDFTSDVDPGSASFVVSVEKLAKLSANARRFLWAGAPVKLYAGNAGDPWASWTLMFDGVVDRFEQQGSLAKLQASVRTEPFENSALTLAYAGTGGIEGGDDLKAKVKPWVFGRALNVEPVLIDAVNSVYQFSAYGPIQAVNVLYERASTFGASVGDYATYAALVAATIPAGRWATCLAQGLIRLGAPAYGVITGDIDGDKPSGTWIRKTGAIISRIATNAGVAGGSIDSASLAALDVAVPYNINLVLTDQATVIDIARRLARPCNAQAGVSWLGKLFVGRVAIGSPVVALDAQGRQRPPVLASVESDVSPPYTRIEMGAARCWRVHTADEIATETPLRERGPYDPATWYMPGNWVTYQGSTWRYRDTATPGSGNAPPTLPTTINTWWEVMAQAGADGEDAQGAIIYDPFNYAALSEFYAQWNTSGAGEHAIIASGDIGGTAIRLGNNAGDDTVYATAAKSLPYSPEDLYEIEWDVEVGSSDPLTLFYLGVTAQDAAGANLPGDNGTYCYVAVTGGGQQANAGRRKYRGYFRGRAAVGAGNNVGGPGPAPDTPALLPNGTVKVAPLFLANYNSRPGTFTLHEMTLRKMEDVSTVVIGNWSNAYTYARNNGAYYGGRLWGSKVDGNLNHQPPSSGTGDAWWYLIGDKGADGADGDYQDQIFYSGYVPPSTPTGSNPSGWAGEPSNNDATEWVSKADKDAAGNLLGTWSAPAIYRQARSRPYNAGTTYYQGNPVSYDGGQGSGTYALKVASSTGNAPSGTAEETAYWAVVAAPGEPGTPGTPPSAFTATINLTSSSGTNLRTAADAAGYPGGDATITFKVPNGVTIRGLAGSPNGGVAIDTGTWPAGYTIALTIVIESGGVVDGGGGKGGGGPTNAGTGGDAIYVRGNITGGVTVNSGGTLRGGGGGGGKGGTWSTGGPAVDREQVGGGGGGGGQPNGPGGARAANLNGDLTWTNSVDGTAGTTGAVGTGGAGGTGAGITAGAGGNGGGYASTGSTGVNPSSTGAAGYNGAVGGAAGYAVRKNGFTCAVTNNGTMLGSAA